MSDIVYNLKTGELQGHDLSFNKVKLDYRTLVNVVANSVRLLGDRVDIHRANLRDAFFQHSYHSLISAELESQWLAEEAERLALAVKTYHALLALQEREELEIINLPSGRELESCLQ